MTNTVQQTTEPSNRAVARRLWVWPIAILISFPIGGYLADLVVDGVDSVGAAMIGGLTAGLVIGAARMVRLEAVGLVALDRGYEHRNGRGPHRRCGTCRLSGQAEGTS